MQGGVLAHHAQAWTDLGATPWVAKAIKEGIRLRWKNGPPPKRRATGVWSSQDTEKAMNDQVSRGLWRLANPEDKVRFVSRAFAIPKSNGKLRLVVDHSTLSTYLSTPHFKMNGVKDVLTAMEQNAWAATLDLKDAYGQCPLHESAARWLAAEVNGKVYLPLGLTQGISVAPFIFTKLVQTAWRAIRRLGVTIIGYLDDSCLLFPKKSYEEAQSLLDQSIAIFQRLGYIVSPEKSTLHPVQRFSFLGLEFNTQTMEVAWPDAKRMAVRDQLHKLLKVKEATPRQTAHTVGALKAAAAAFPSVHLLTFNVQRALAQSASSRGWDTTFALPPAALEELRALHRLIGKPVINTVRNPSTAPFEALLVTDAAPSYGWGSTLKIQDRTWEYGERWPPSVLGHHSTELEMQALENAINHFAPLLRNTHLKVQSDCATVVHDLRRRRVGAARLLPIAKRIIQTCESLQVVLSIEHLPGVLNVQSDKISRTEEHHGLVLRAEVFNRIQEKLGHCDVDCFATESNAKLPRFWTLYPSSKAEHQDFFSQHLDPNTLYYVFPPPGLLYRALAVLRDQQAQAIVIAPDFPAQIWEPLLLRMSKRTLRLGQEALVPTSASQELPPGQTWTAYRVGPQVNCSEQPELHRPGANMTANGRNSPATVQQKGYKSKTLQCKRSSSSSPRNPNACARAEQLKQRGPLCAKVRKSEATRLTHMTRL